MTFKRKTVHLLSRLSLTSLTSTPSGRRYCDFQEEDFTRVGSSVACVRACVRGVMIVYEVCHPEGNGYARLTTIWSVSIFFGLVTSRNTTTTTTTRVIRFDNFIKHNSYIGCVV